MAKSTRSQPEHLIFEAAEFRAQLEPLAWQPNEWADEGEICFEWISSDRHAIVSIEGDGEIGYAMLVDGKFVAGAEVCSPSRLPNDLARYLSRTPGDAL